jgi:gliding motility-associated-like protein
MNNTFTQLVCDKTKSMKNYFSILLIIIIFMFCLFVFNTAGYAQSKGWSIEYSPQKAFIENQGQFQIPKSNENVLFSYDGGSTKIYFTKNGISYNFIKALPKESDEDMADEKFTTPEEWKEKEAEEHRVEYLKDAVSMHWQNANPDVEVLAYDVTPDYYCYYINNKDGSKKNLNHVKGYKKIVYKNLYPGIDVEYVFHPIDGLKYTLIIHQGANISNVMMNYSRNPQLNANGDLLLSTRFGDIIDHAPTSFYEDNKTNKLESLFSIQGNSVTFQLGSFDNTKTIVIDPWTQSPSIPNSNGVWECEHDAAGNVYIIGGEMPMKLLKYNSGGVIQWTYSTPYDTASSWLGTFATDLAGNSFVTQGSIAGLQKIDASAGVVWTWNAPLLSTDEYWNIAFNCDQTKLIVGGTSGGMFSLHGAIFYINTANGAVLSNQPVAYGNMLGIPISIQEVRSITSCRNSRYYFLTLDTLGCIDDNYSACSQTPMVFKMNHGYHLSYRCENFKQNTGNSGIMAIRANRYFVYTQNGSTIQKRSLIDGSVISSASIPGGNTITDPIFGQHQLANAGIDIDTCGNVYVGSSDGVYKFDANLNLITSIPTSFKVYDVAVSTNGDVVFCGSTQTSAYNGNRNGTVQSAPMSACPYMTLYCCDANICPAGPMCNNDPAITLTSSTGGGTWSGPGVDPVTGVFDPSAAGAGTITITYSLACGSSSINITVNPCGCPTITPTPSNVVDVCAGQTNGSFTVNTSGGTGPYDYTLLDGATPIASYSNIGGPQDFTGLGAGTYTLNVLDSTGCPGNIIVTISSLTNLNPVISGPTSICDGNPATLDAGSGYTSYLWSTNATSQTISISTSGTYSVTVSNGSGCSGSATVNISSTVITAILTPQNEGCLHACDGGITSNISGGTGPYTYAWSNGQTTPNLTGICAGNYSLTVTDSGSCVKTVTTNIGTDVLINANFTANPQSGSIPLSVTFTYTGTGATSWYWDFGDGTNYNGQFPPAHTYDSLGNYYVVLIVSSGNPDNCSDTSNITIEVQKPSLLIVPNIFTPNNDGHNDEFIIQYKEIESFECVIYNRWGKKIFEWTDIDKGWDGKTKAGSQSADGVYYYIITAKGYDKVEYNLSGTVTLMR